MKKVLKLMLVLILTLSMMISSFVWVGAYDVGDVILDESKINDETKIAANIKDKIGSSTITWNGTTDRLHVKAPGQGAIEIATGFAPTTEDAFTVSADFYILGNGGSSTTQGRLGLGLYSMLGTNSNGWVNGLYSWIGMDNGWGDTKGAVQYNEANSATGVSFTNTSDYKKSPGYTGTDLKNYAKCISFKLVVDPAADSKVSAYFDGKLVSTISSEITKTGGKIFIFVRNTEFEVDNLKITYDLDTESVYDIENGTYEDGAVIINEQMIAEMAGADGNTNAIFGANSDMTWDGDKIVFTPSGNVRRQLANFPTALNSYTLSVDFCVAEITNMTDTKLVHVGINELPAWANGSLLQFSVLGSSTESDGTSAHSYFSHKNASNATGTSHGARLDYNEGAYDWETYINFKIKVGLETASFYVDNALITSVPVEDFLLDFDAPYIGGRGGIIYFDNLMVYAGTGDAPTDDDVQVGTDGNIAYYGHQRTVVADDTYGLRFISEVVTVKDYSAIGFKVDVTSSNGSVTKNFDKNGNEVYKKVIGNVDGAEKSYTPNDGYTALAAFSLTDIQMVSGVTYTFVITPYAIDKDGNTILYAPYEVQYNGSAEPINRA